MYNHNSMHYAGLRFNQHWIGFFGYEHNGTSQQRDLFYSPTFTNFLYGLSGEFSILDQPVFGIKSYDQFVLGTLTFSLFLNNTQPPSSLHVINYMLFVPAQVTCPSGLALINQHFTECY